MHDIIKRVWSILFVIFIMGLIALIPYNRYQEAYFNELYKIRSLPQRRIDAVYRYIEAVENGWEDISDGILTEPPHKYYGYEEPFQISPDKTNEKLYLKPRYIRDKNNMKIYYRYQGR